MFLFRDPEQVMIAGIVDGPGSRSGVHYGDIVISVNGVRVSGKTAVGTGKNVFIFETRDDSITDLPFGSRQFALAKAADVARQNGVRLEGDDTVPIEVADQDVHCFLHWGAVHWVATLPEWQI